MKGKHSSSVIRLLREEHEATIEEGRRRERELRERLARAERRAERADGLQERCDELERLVGEGASPELAHTRERLARAERQLERLTDSLAHRQALLDRAYSLLVPRAGYPSDAAYLEAIAEVMGTDCNPDWHPNTVVVLDTPSRVAGRLGGEAIARIQRARRQR